MIASIEASHVNLALVNIVYVTKLYNKLVKIAYIIDLNSEIRA